VNIIPFDSGKVPATISQMFGESAKDLVGNSSSGFPVISIKGKVFHINRGQERILVTKPGEEDPAASIEVVVLRANPNRSKVYYPGGYTEGAQDKPTCYSNNGIEPEADATAPQSKKCATCAHNQWGSRITESGVKAKACTDSRRLAIATLDTPNDPMLVRVPAASMKALEEYGKVLAARGLPSQVVLTKIGFDYSVAHPALTFKPVGLIGDAAQLAEIKAASESELVAQIVGMAPVPAADAPAQEEEAPAPVVTKPAAVRTTPTKPTITAESAVEKAVAAATATTKVKVNVEAAPAPTAQNTAALEQQIGSMIEDMNFDD
jgi:hypothetical protein